MEKQHFSVARVVTHTKENISKFERHNERKNTTYSNTNIVTERTPMNIYFKRFDSTLNQKFDELVKKGQISTRGLKANAKIYNELVFDVNSLYFEQNGGYDFAKRFYEKAYNFAEKEMGTENILTAVLHADELNTALTEEFGEEIYHYDLHLIAIPVVQKEIKYSKRCKDKSLVGKTKDYFYALKLAPQRVANFFKSLFDKEQQEQIALLYLTLQNQVNTVERASKYEKERKSIMCENRELKEKCENLEKDYSVKLKEEIRKVENKYEDEIYQLEKENSFLRKVINTFQKTVDKFIHWVCKKFSVSSEEEFIRDFKFENDIYIDPEKQIEYEETLEYEEMEW